MISVKEAAKKAREYFIALSEEQLTHISLEEIELAASEKYWRITLGYTTNDVFTTRYKIFKIDAITGDFLSMKIRTV